MSTTTDLVVVGDFIIGVNAARVGAKLELQTLERQAELVNTFHFQHLRQAPAHSRKSANSKYFFDGWQVARGD